MPTSLYIGWFLFTLVVLVPVIDFGRIFLRNCKLHIESNDQAWNDWDYKTCDTLYNHLGAYYVFTSVVSVIYGAFSLIIFSIIADVSVERAAILTDKLDVFSLIYIAVIIGVGAVTGVLNYLRFMHKMKELTKK